MLLTEVKKNIYMETHLYARARSTKYHALALQW